MFSNEVWIAHSPLHFLISFPSPHANEMGWVRWWREGNVLPVTQTSWRVHTKLTEVRDHPHKLLLYFLFLAVYVFVCTYFEFKLYWEHVSRRCVGGALSGVLKGYWSVLVFVVSTKFKWLKSNEQSFEINLLIPTIATAQVCKVLYILCIS